MKEKLTHFRIGQIVNTQGLKGEVRVYPYVDDINRFDNLQSFYLGKNFNEEFEVAHLGKRMYTPVIDTRLDPRGKPYYWIGGEPYEFDKPGSDGYELRKAHKTTITPLKLDLTSDMSLIKEWLD